MSTRIKYFAYGSNMLTARLRERVPSARPVDVAQLRGHSLVWNKRSRDGSGKCSVIASGREEDVVWGVLFELEAQEKGALDRVEGLGCGYDEGTVEVMVIGGAVHALTYLATDTDDALQPYDWYKELVLAGAREHSLPQYYIEVLEFAHSIPDPDGERAGSNRRLIGAS
ncbi:MAG TPA: gamma-glutamylcyclotransferase family protein [Polaromonas sp.]